MIPREKIEELREKADIVQIISEYVPLKKRGKNYLGLCPFHSEKTPSFTVSPEKQLFHCFGCGEGGNVFAFLMKADKVDFPEAAHILGEKLGVYIEKAPSSGPAQSFKDRLFEINALAGKFYENNLDCDIARAYLKKRGLSPEIAKKFGLGYAKDLWNDLTHFLMSRGAKAEDIESAGLILPRKEKEGFYDRFRNRLIFPIFDLRGRTLGFSGRALLEEEPKYLNSPDSAVFSKGENLFGLNLAKEEIKKRKFAILVEGNVDVLSVSLAGFPNVVAPLGTALTALQSKLLARFAETVVLAFDSDAAGLAASERSQEILKEAGLKVRIADLKKFKDPDEYVRAEGREAFFETIKKSRPALEFKIGRILARYNLTEIEPRAQAAYQVAELLSREKDHLVQQEYIKYAAPLLKLNPELLAAEVAQRGFYFKSTAGHPSRRVLGKPSQKLAEAEKSLVRLALESEEAFALIKENLGIEEFLDPNYQAIMAKLMTRPAKELLGSFSSEVEERIVREALLVEHPEEDVERVVKDCIGTIKAFHVKKQLEAAREALVLAETSRDLDRVKQASFEYKSLSEIYQGRTR